MSPRDPLRVLLLGATGTVGRATLAALVEAGHGVTCLVRPGSGGDLSGVRRIEGQATEMRDLERVMGGGFDAIVSGLASRSGAATDARAVDEGAHLAAIEAARAHGIGHFVLVSAICVQKPRLPFQQAKLAVEASLAASGLRYSIVRPTALFKSLSGQVARVRAGRPFLVFGDGRLTACKPISDADLGEYVAGCLTEPSRWNRVLPIGGPGPALTPLDQAALLFDALEMPPRIRRVPTGLLDLISGGLGTAGRLSPRLAAKAELARIGRYYATESMLVWDPVAGRYDAAATPEWGRDTLGEHYRRMARGEIRVDLGPHAVF